MDGGGLRMMVLRLWVLQALFGVQAGLTAATFVGLGLCQRIVGWVYSLDLLRLESPTRVKWVGIGLLLTLVTILLRLTLLLTTALSYLTQRTHGVIVTLCIGERD